MYLVPPMSIRGFSRCRPGVGLQRPYYDVQGPTIHGALHCIILGDAVLNGNAHYVAEARRHFPCVGEGCHWCRDGRGKRRKGYIAAVTRYSRQKFVLELSDCAMNQLDKVLAAGTNLRGLMVTLKRHQSKSGGFSKTAKVILTIDGIDESDNLPEAFDETPHLEKMWGMRDDHEPPSPSPVPAPAPRPVSPLAGVVDVSTMFADDDF